jgi:SpoVK/Ycf46/Vps4 family AAA+-type ATPase
VKLSQACRVIAATNRPRALDAALRRPGRLDKEIVVSPPNVMQRQLILACHCAQLPLHGDVDLSRVAKCSSGYTGADLAAVCQEAARLALSEAVKDGKAATLEPSTAGKIVSAANLHAEVEMSEEFEEVHALQEAISGTQRASAGSAVAQKWGHTGCHGERSAMHWGAGPSETGKQYFESREAGARPELAVRAGHFTNALLLVRPSLVRGVAVDLQPMSWDDIGGLQVGVANHAFCGTALVYPFALAFVIFVGTEAVCGWLLCTRECLLVVTPQCLITARHKSSQGVAM